MSLAILGIGTALPDHTVKQARAEEVARQVAERTGARSSTLAVLYRRSGVEERHTVLTHPVALEWLRRATREEAGDGGGGASTGERMRIYGEEARLLALRAARNALDASGVAPGSVSHLITVSCTGFAAPGVDVALLKGLGLPATVERTHLGFMGCHGALNGLRVARAVAASDPRARLLLCAVELCSLHYHYGADAEKLVANAIFGDGAAALVGAPSAVAPESAWRVAASGSSLFPDSEEAMTWTIGDHGFEMRLSTRVPDLIRECLRPWVEEWLRKEGLDLPAVRSWAVHPGGPRILTAVEQSLGLDAEATAASRAVLASCGNMSSPTVLFILDRLARSAAPRPCVALGFGPGLVAEAALIR